MRLYELLKKDRVFKGQISFWGETSACQVGNFTTMGHSRVIVALTI